MRRTIAIVAALVLATLGTVLLVNYVRSAEERALEGEELVDVLVVDDEIPEGARYDDIVRALRVEQVPTKVAATDVVGDVTELEGLVTNVALVPGEQVIGSRFITEEAYLAALAAEGTIDVPSDLLEVTFAFDPARAVGGQIEAGDIVTVFASFDPFSIDFRTIEPSELTDEEIEVILTQEQEEAEEGEEPLDTSFKTPNTTKIILHDVLVSSIQLEQAPREISDEEGSGPTVRLAPTGNLLVTVAINPEDATRMVFTAEFGRIWLAREGADVPNDETQVETRGTIYGDPDEAGAP